MAPQRLQSRLWSIVSSCQQIDPQELLVAIESEVTSPVLDYRTRLLIHEAAKVLEERWGQHALRSRLSAPGQVRVASILNEHFPENGFPSLGRRVMKTTRRETILQFLRELSEQIDTPTQLIIGGSSALILHNLLSRSTEDIDVVDEVPRTLRSEHRLLRRLSDRYGLSLAHFQSHYLPEGWETRTKYLDRFGSLEVRLVDCIDIFLGKLFSRREKDRDDLRALSSQLDRSQIERRLESAGQSMLADQSLRDAAERNWRIVFGGPFPE